MVFTLTNTIGKYAKNPPGGEANMVAVSNGGNLIASSTDGNTWTGRTPNAFYSGNSVAYGNGLWVAVGGNGGNTSIKNVSTSTNGITWSGQNYAGINNISGVAYGKNSSGNGVWIICGQSTIATSPNGTSWTACASTGGIGNPVRNVAFGKDGAGADLWIAVGSNSQTTIARSTDGGNTWAACATKGGINHTATSAAYGKNGAGAGLWVAVGYGGSAGSGNSIAYSSDGDTWYPYTNAQVDGFTGQMNDVAYGKDDLGAGLWVITGSATTSGYMIGTSPDGINWTKRLVNAPFSNNSGQSVAYGQDALGNWLWVAGNAGNAFAKSTNGTAWTSVTSNGGLTAGIMGIAFKN